MRYIKTKDGRIIDLSSGWEIDCEVRDNYSLLYYDEGGNCKDGFMLSKKDIIKQADTIEELCDEFVIRWSNKTYCDNLMKTLNQARYWLANDSNAKIYGAVWTDKGLIYVAKMNDKGELELL